MPWKAAHRLACVQGDHSLDDVKFPDNSMTFSRRFVALLPMLSVTHITPVLVLMSVVGIEIQQCMIQNQNEIHKLSKIKNWCKYAANNKHFRPLFSNKTFSLTLPWQLSNSLIFPGFPDKWSPWVWATSASCYRWQWPLGELQGFLEAGSVGSNVQWTRMWYAAAWDRVHSAIDQPYGHGRHS